MSELTLRGVHKNFGGVHAVSDLDLSIRPGIVTGLIGPNGAGKTTVVNLITGMLKVSSGRITFGDEDITAYPAEKVARSGIARTFQNIRLLREATVVENLVVGFHRLSRVGLAASMLGLPSSRREQAEHVARAHELLERFGMTRFAGYLAGELSYGHQRRVEMMRALAMDPRVILLDEPVAGMNDVEAGELGEIFTGLARSGLGVLLIEHNIRFVSQVCSHVHVVNSGRAIAAGTPAEVTSDPDVITAYLGS